MEVSIHVFTNKEILYMILAAGRAILSKSDDDVRRLFKVTRRSIRAINVDAQLEDTLLNLTVFFS